MLFYVKSCKLSVAQVSNCCELAKQIFVAFLDANNKKNTLKALQFVKCYIKKPHLIRNLFCTLEICDILNTFFFSPTKNNKMTVAVILQLFAVVVRTGRDPLSDTLKLNFSQSTVLARI